MIFIAKTLRRHVFASSPIHKLCILDLFPISRSISTCSIDPNQPSFQVSSCGLSPESAFKTSTSKRITFENPEKPDKVFTFLKNHGFSEAQVSKIIKESPQLITSNPEKTLLPKLHFFYSKGISVPQVAKILSANHLLKRSLGNHIIPTFDFLTKFLQSEDKAIYAIQRFPILLVCDFHRSLVPIFDILQNHGVPKSNMMMLLKYQTRLVMPSSERLTEIIEAVKKMGFDPSKVSFVIAIHALRSMSKPTWERKVEVYKRWGWSHEEILHAFRKYPWCMAHSEESISAKMGFFVNKMGWDPSVVACRPQYISLSLENRIIPRCTVLIDLLSKGLIKKKYKVSSLLESTEQIFLQKYVYCYKDEAPHLLKIYHEKLGGAKKER